MERKEKAKIMKVRRRKGQCKNVKQDRLIDSLKRNLLSFSLMQRNIEVFFSFCTNRSQACSHMLGYIPGPIGILFAIALHTS